ncbi:MAG TPA: hypothetical protein VF407_09550, partial [Polyangiaceae bacterium]
MRARVSISVCIAVLAGVGAVHCVGDEPKVGVVGDDDGGGVTGDGGGGSGGDGAIGDGGSGSDAAPSVIDVDGTLVLPNDDDTSPSTAPLANRQIVVLDANGVLTKVTSGADGKFHVGGVKTPYDTLVPFDAPDAGGIVTPVYIGGLTRSNPTLFGVPFGPRVSPEHSATIAFSENVPTGSTIVVSAGEYNHPNPGTGSTQIFNSFAATWYGPSTTTTASVGLLQYDSSGTFTKFGLVGMQTFTDGVTKALGSPTLAALGANKTVTITATPPGTYSISSNLARFVTADNTFLGTSEAATATATLNVPPLLSTQVFLESQANGPNNSQSTAFVTYADYTTMPAT